MYVRNIEKRKKSLSRTQEINIKAQRNRRKSDTIISLVCHGEEHSSFPFWEGADAFSLVLERKEGDRHWNERKATDIGTKEGDRHIGTKKGGKHIGKERKNRRFRDFSKKKKKNVDKIIRHIVIYRSCLENRREHNCGCSSMVECQPSKLNTWVRFPSPAFLPR